MSRQTRTRAFSAVALGVAAVVALSAMFAAGPAGAAETVDPRLTLAQANVQAYCTDLSDDATTTRQRNTRADLCTMWKRELADLTVTPTATPTTSPTVAPTTTAPPTTPAPTTSSPTPSPTTSPSGWPDATTTGVPAGVTLKVTSGRTITLPGVVIDGEEIQGCLVVAADNVTVKNSRILGDGCFYAVQNKALNLTLSDVEITCGNTSGTGVTAANYTLIRADISGCENGLNIGGNVALIDSWIHDLAMVGADPHTDGVQMNEGAGNILIRHNHFQVPQRSTSSIIMWDEGGAQNFNVLVELNRLAGGGYVVYCPRQAASNVRVVDNRIGNWGYGPQNSCWLPNATFTGNTRLDGSPL